MKSIVPIFALVSFSCASLPPPEVKATAEGKPIVIYVDKDGKPFETALQEKQGTDPVQTPKDPMSVEVQVFKDPAKKNQAPQNGKTVRPQESINKNTADYTVEPKEEDYNGGAVVYNFVPNRIYQIFLAPLRVTALTLEPGEKIISPPASGDTTNFVLGTGVSVINGSQATVLHMKTISEGKSTNMSVSTDRRVYNFVLSSYKETYMPMVSFKYPLDDYKLTTGQKVKDKALQDLTVSGSITNFDFSYEIVKLTKNAIAWAPNIVFNDGKKTYIQFFSADRTSYAPVLFQVIDGKRVVTNYRVAGDYYIVDEVLNHFELIVDVNDNNIVTVKRRR